MKKNYISLFILSFFCLSASAQTIPNSGFETWTTYPSTSIEDPNNWFSSNLSNEFSANFAEVTEQAALDLLGPGYVATTTVPPSVVKVPGRTGTYAMKVQNVVMTTSVTYNGVPVSSTDTDPMPGYADVYSVNSGGGNVQFGVHVTASPVSLNGYYKFNQGGTSVLDSGVVWVTLGKWNSTNMESDSIGGGTIIFKTNATSFTAFTVNITNTSGIVPDTAFIEVASSWNQAHTNTYLIVDDLSFSSASGITPIFSNTTGIALYPNPAKDQVTIKNLPLNAGEVQVMDYMGRRVANVSALGSEVNLNTSSFASGLYFYNVLDNTGVMLYSSRFTVAN
jgi:hypothetical protein